MKIPSNKRLVLVPVAASLVLGACTILPTGPSVMALPGSRKTVEQFNVDAFDCQQYAQAVISSASGATAANADNAAASTAAASAVAGAAVGAILGAVTGQAGQGAAIGAGTGLLFGGASGSYYTTMSSYQLQRGYDGAYLDCMYSRGNRVPAGSGYTASTRSPSSSYPPPNQPPPPKSSIVGPAKPVYAPAPGTPPAAKYPAPPNVPSSSYPPADAPPPSNLPPKN